MSTNPKMAEHVFFCLQYVARSFRKEIQAHSSLMSKTTDVPGIEYDYLWMVFKPGVLIYNNENDMERVYKLIQMSWEWGSYCMRLQHIACNGKTFLLTASSVLVQRYDGCIPLTDLSHFPLACHPERARIKRKSIARGRKYVSLAGIHHRSYYGKADLLKSKSKKQRPRSDHDEFDDPDDPDDYDDEMNDERPDDQKRGIESTQVSTQPAYCLARDSDLSRSVRES